MTDTTISQPLLPYQAPRWTASHILLGSAAFLLILLAWQWLLPSQKARWVAPAPQAIDVAQLLPPLPDLDGNNIATRLPQRQTNFCSCKSAPCSSSGASPRHH